MARQKVKTLFNKNHISITKIENTLNDKEGIESIRSTGGYYPHYAERKHYEFVDVVKESPLGFYYTKSEQRVKQGSPDIREVRWKGTNSIGGYEIKLKTTTYKISYVNKSGENTVTTDGLRPWEVVSGDGTMPEHLIFALKDVIDSIITIAEDHKLKFANGAGADCLKKYLYRTMFGNEKGIRFQTDSEKILSHGFDLKTSFRNPKTK